MITHKVVHKLRPKALERLANPEVAIDRGAWEDFNSANHQAIRCAESMRSNGSVEVHELIAGTADTKKIALRYVVEFSDDASKLVSIRTRTMRLEIPP